MMWITKNRILVWEIDMAIQVINLLVDRKDRITSDFDVILPQYQ